MVARTCLDCGAITGGANRCPRHQASRQVQRGTTAQRGYNAPWRRLVAQAMQTQRDRVGTAYCVDCGLTEAEAKATGNPLTGDHVTPKVCGGRDELSNVAIRCRRHNSSKGSR